MKYKKIILTDKEIKELKDCIEHYESECLSQDSDKEFKIASRILNKVYEKLEMIEGKK